MAVVLFTGVIVGQTMRVVDRGAGLNPRLIVELKQPDDAMGAARWAAVDPITRVQFEALLLASGVVT